MLHVHSGGFVGTAAQYDWLNSHLAVNLPALVVSVDRRVLGPDVPMSAVAADGWDVLQQVTGHAEQWGSTRLARHWWGRVPAGQSPR